MSAKSLGLAALAAAFALGVTFAAATEHAHPHWSYSGATGPAKWSMLESDFGTCSQGHTQSPIDIRDAEVTKADLPRIDFQYQGSPLKIVDNGHTIQVTYAPGSFITVGDARYELVQFHFHKPSEEKINGKRSAMVAHLVHKDSAGKLAVVAVLLRGGTENALLKTVWEHLPPKPESESDVDAVTINVSDLLPTDRSYYTFTGSLTTPPCTEGVTWFVLRNPGTVSVAQVATFAKHYPMNARPVQPLDGRIIKASR